MQHRLLSGIILWTLSQFGIAGTVSPELAQQAAIQFYNRHSPAKIENIFIKSDAHLPLYYILNMVPDGWVIISAENTVIPILAYSFSGKYQDYFQAPQFVAWMKQYEDQIVYARQQNIKPSPSVAATWEQLLSDAACHKTRENRTVDPLLYTHWDQGFPYNEYCPDANGGPGGHAWAGCVPTAMAQVMNYYRWPESGTGSYTYEDPPYGTLTADFGNTYYQWNNMPASINSSNPALAELLFHLGVSCDLQYGPDGSGMYNHKAAYALRTFFKYSPQTQYIFRDSTHLDWDSILIAHLDRKMPLYYAGWSVPDVNGHAFVCDGYQDTSYFHFNFGWSGNSDGYFYTDDLVPGGNNFNLAQEVIINIFPDTLNYEYPHYCSGFTDLTFSAGSLEDGSGPIGNYQPLTQCSWLIHPQNEEDSISGITLTFHRLNTMEDDSVSVYDGSNFASPLLGSFSGDTLPSPIMSSGNAMLIKFTSMAGHAGPGFSASYTSQKPFWCHGTTTITEDTALITDGSFSFNYLNNTNCRWKLIPQKEGPLTIYFKKFDTEPVFDNLRIYDLATLDTLVVLSGHYSPDELPDSVASPSGQMFLVFSTNNSITGKGWEFEYPRSHVGIHEVNEIKNLNIFPNPVTEDLHLKFQLDKTVLLGITLTSLEGKLILSETIEGKTGWNNSGFSVKNIPNGIYLMQVKTNETLIHKKLIIHKP